MKTLAIKLQNYLRWKAPNKTANLERPFYWMLTGVFIFIYAYSVYTVPALQQPGRFILFTVLMLVHTLLHWLNDRFDDNLPPAFAYLALQGVLAFTIAVLGQNIAPAIGLFLAMIGEASGMVRQTRWGILAIVAFLGLSALNFGLVMGWGSLVYWAATVTPTAVFVVIYVVLYTRQAEARNRAQALLAELEIANRRLSEYAARVEDLTIANERQRMARELHDTLSQGLAGLILQLEAADAHLANNRPERAQTIVKQTMQQARGTLADARAAIDNLRQQGAGPQDLEALLKDEAARFTNATGIPCELQIELPEGAAERLKDSLCETLLRAVSEGLTNIARHAQASQAHLHVALAGGRLSVEISDNGCGFDPAIPIQSGHYGLLGMRERLRLAGGELCITSQPGQGTQIKLEAPL